MSYSSRFWLYAPLMMFLALAAWAMGYWWVVAGAFDKRLTALNNHEAVPGITLSYTSKTISGFPFNIDVVFTGFKIAGSGAHGPFAWQTEQFALHRLTYGRTQDIYEAAGGQTLSWTDGAGRAHSITFLPGTLHASAVIDAKGLARFDLDGVDVGGKDSDGGTLAIGRAQFHLRRDPKEDALDVMISADQVRTKNLQLGALSAYATLSHGTALMPLLAGKEAWPAAAVAWRQAGGAVLAGRQTGDIVADAILNPLY